MNAKRLIALSSAIMIIAFAIAIMPFKLTYELDLKHPMDLLIPNIAKNEASANPVVVNGAKNFIKVAAAEAGLTPGQFVATTVGMVTVGYGYDITKGVGVNMADAVENSVSNLIDAADYPEYSTLSEEEKQQWGSKDNYDCAKYNSLLNAFGMGEAQTRFFGSGGGDLDEPGDYDGWTQTEKDTLAKIGRIGNLWADGARAKFGDIIAAMTGKEQVVAWIGNEATSLNFKNSDYYQNGWPETVFLSQTNLVGYHNPDGHTYVLHTNVPVYTVIVANTSTTIALLSFSTALYGNSRTYSLDVPSTYYNASKRVTNGHTWYRTSDQCSSGYCPQPEIYCNQQINGSYSNPVDIYSGFVDAVEQEILFGSVGLTGGEPEQIAGYPEQDIPDDEKIYFPDTGITPGITYNYFVTPTRQNNIYNPDNQTGGEDWKDETESNVLPLLNIQFDKLFPFCMLFDIQKLFDKVTAVTGNSGTQETYMTVSIPLDVPGFSQGETLDLNLQWLHDLLITVRPFVQILLAAGLLFVTIRFWQGVLTG